MRCSKQWSRCTNVGRRVSDARPFVATDGPELGSQITNDCANAILDGLQKSALIVNAVTLNTLGWTESAALRDIPTRAAAADGRR